MPVSEEPLPAPTDDAPLESSHEEGIEDSSSLDIPIALRQGTRTCTLKSLYPLSNFVTYSALLSSYKSCVLVRLCVYVRNTWQEAMNHKHWHDSMLEEMSDLQKNRT